MSKSSLAAAPSTARLEARISVELYDTLKRAAAIQGRTITDFVASAILEASNRVIEQSEIIRLSRADQERFAQALLAPPAPAPALKRAFTRRRELIAE